MASAPAALPLFYKQVVPLNKEQHGTWRARQTNRASWLANNHAVPLTVEEFPAASRHFPIIFSAGAEPVPLALMGMSEGINVFVSEDGTVNEPIYMPAYVRRYPFILAKINPEAEELSLCVDPTSDLVGAFDDGRELFNEDGTPTQATMDTLKFCEQFEVAGSKTKAFLDEMKKHDLLMDGELGVRRDGSEEPIVYRGFRILNEDKLKELRGDVIRGWVQSGIMALVYAHIFSLQTVREIFGRQVKQGKAPQGQTVVGTNG